LGLGFTFKIRLNYNCESFSNSYLLNDFNGKHNNIV
jgi:hypothetical protein